MLQYLISKCGSAVSRHFDVLMFIACKLGYIEIMGFLLKCSTPHDYTEDEVGNSLFHHAVAGKKYERSLRNSKTFNC
jgi:hypothetical protein